MTALGRPNEQVAGTGAGTVAPSGVAGAATPDGGWGPGSGSQANVGTSVALRDSVLPVWQRAGARPLFTGHRAG